MTEKNKAPQDGADPKYILYAGMVLLLVVGAGVGMYYSAPTIKNLATAVMQQLTAILPYLGMAAGAILLIVLMWFYRPLRYLGVFILLIAVWMIHPFIGGWLSGEGYGGGAHYGLAVALGVTAGMSFWASHHIMSSTVAPATRDTLEAIFLYAGVGLLPMAIAIVLGAGLETVAMVVVGTFAIILIVNFWPEIWILLQRIPLMWVIIGVAVFFGGRFFLEWWSRPFTWRWILLIIGGIMAAIPEKGIKVTGFAVALIGFVWILLAW